MTAQARPVRKVRVLKRRPLTRRRVITMVAVLGVLILLASSISLFSRNVVADDYTFGSETVTKGYTVTPANRNANDGSFESLIEADQYTNANFSGTTETITQGTGSGAAFPGAFDTDDASRRAYQEANTAAADTAAIIRPESDTQAQFVPYPASPTTHYDKIDETTAGGDTTDYIYPDNAADIDFIVMANPSTPSGSPTYDIRMWAICAKNGGAQLSNIQGGIRIGSTNYEAFNVNPTRDTTAYTNYSKGWTTDPSDTNEWTLTDLNGLSIYFATSDISPVPRVYQAGIYIWINYTTVYTTDVSIEYTGVVSDGQTVSYQVFCQGYRSGTENFYVYAWDYTASGWSTVKATIAAASDTNYDFALTSDQRDAVNNKVKLRILDELPTSAVQDTVTFDVLKVNAIKAGYAVDVSMTAASAAQYGDIGLQVKGKCSAAENFYVALWNYTAAGWDATVITVTGATNTLYTYDIRETWQRSTQEVKIRFTDSVAQTTDQSVDTCFLDWAVVTLYHVDPTVSNYASTNNGDGGENTDIYIWATYTDADNEAPEYMRVYWGAGLHDMTKNNSGDTTYYNGCDYYYHVGTASPGTYLMQLRWKDVNSAEKFQTIDTFVVHANPTLTQTGVTPVTGNNGDTFKWFTTYDQVDDSWYDYVKVDIGGTEYDMVKNDSGDIEPPVALNYSKAMSGGTWSWHIHYKTQWSIDLSTTPVNLVVNNAPSMANYGLAPADPRYRNTLLNATVTYTDVDNDPPAYVCFRFTSGGVLNATMLAVDAGDTTYSDGKAYYVTWYQEHGAYNYEYACSDGKKPASGGSGTLTIGNRAPDIPNGPAAHFDAWRNVAWSFDFNATDADDDSVGWQKSGTSWLTIGAVDGVLSGTTPDAAGTYSFTVWANDSYSGSDSYAFDIHVSNRAPTIDNLVNDFNYNRNTYWEHAYTAMDADLDTIVWSRAFGPSWLMIDANTGVVSGTTTNTPGPYTFIFRANDGHGGITTDPFAITVVNQAPDITNGPGAHVDQYRDQGWYFDFSATDGDSDTLAWESGGPAWLSIGSSDGNLSGTTTDTPGTYSFTVWANDSYSGSDSYAFDIHVSNRAPSITSTGNTTVWDGDFMSYHIVASDADEDGLTYELSTNATFLSLDGAWLNGTATPVGTYWYRVWANDSYGGSDLEYEDLAVNENVAPNNPPYFTSTPIYNVANNSAYSYDANATDDDLDPLTFDLETDNMYLGIDPDTGVVSGTPHLAGDFYVHISITDGEATIWQNFTLHATSIAPSWTTTPTYSVANNSAYYYDSGATDPEGETLYYDLTGSATAFLTINHATGVISGTPHLAGTYAANLTCIDYTNTIWQNWSIEVTTTAPSFISSPTTTKANHSAYYYDANANDPEGETLLFALYGNATFLSMNTTSGVVNGTMGWVGWYYVNISVSDYTFTVWQNFTLWSTNTPPYFTSDPVVTAELNVSYYYHANVDDADGDVIFYDLGAHPAWMFINNVTGEVEGTPNGYGSWLVEISAFDGSVYVWQNFTLDCSEAVVPPVPPSVPPSLLMGAFIIGMTLFALVLGMRMVRRSQHGDEPRPQREDRR